jgi:hypothetical protein
MISLFPNNPEKKLLRHLPAKQEQVIIPTIDSLHIEKSVDGLTKVGLSQQNNDTIKRYYSKQIKLKSTVNRQLTRFPIRKLLILDINQSLN